jgi:hypothetical protein
MLKIDAFFTVCCLPRLGARGSMRVAVGFGPGVLRLGRANLVGRLPGVSRGGLKPEMLYCGGGWNREGAFLMGTVNFGIVSERKNSGGCSQNPCFFPQATSLLKRYQFNEAKTMGGHNPLKPLSPPPHKGPSPLSLAY